MVTTGAGTIVAIGAGDTTAGIIGIGAGVTITGITGTGIIVIGEVHRRSTFARDLQRVMAGSGPRMTRIGLTPTRSGPGRRTKKPRRRRGFA